MRTSSGPRAEGLNRVLLTSRVSPLVSGRTNKQKPQPNCPRNKAIYTTTCANRWIVLASSLEIQANRVLVSSRPETPCFCSRTLEMSALPTHPAAVISPPDLTVHAIRSNQVTLGHTNPSSPLLIRISARHFPPSLHRAPSHDQQVRRHHRAPHV